MDRHSSTAVTVVKAFSILNLLAHRAGSTVSLAEVAAHIGTSKSTAHRYLTTLEELGVVERDAKDRFQLGPKLIELAGMLLAEHDLRRESEPFLLELASQTQETVHLAVPSGNEVVYLAKVESPHPIRMASRIGARMPMYSTALGKAILAHLPPERVQEIVDAGIPPRTPHTVSSAEALRAELAKVQAQGFALDDQENELGVRCVGAPVFDYSGEVVGAVSVSGPAHRLSREMLLKLGPLVRETALKISRRLGYPVPESQAHDAVEVRR